MEEGQEVGDGGEGGRGSGKVSKSGGAEVVAWERAEGGGGEGGGRSERRRKG